MKFDRIRHLKRVGTTCLLPGLFFLLIVAEGRYSNGTVVRDLWAATVPTAMADSCAWDVLNDQAISTALFSVREEPLLISFSLTLGELVPKTMRSYIILSGCLKSRFWAIKDQRCVDLWWISKTRLRQKHAQENQLFQRVKYSPI